MAGRRASNLQWTGARDVRVVITACGSRTATHGFIDSLELSGFYTPTLIGIDLIGREQVDSRFSVYRSTRSETFCQDVLELIENQSADVVVPLIEEDLSRLAEFGESLYNYVAGPPRSLVAALCDKAVFFESAQKTCPRLVPDFCIIRERNELGKCAVHLGYPIHPLVLKPSRGRGARGVFIVSNEPLRNDTRSAIPSYSLEELIRRIHIGEQPLLLMQFLDGADFTIFCMARNGSLEFAVPLRRHRFTPGITWAGSVESNKVAIAAAHEIASSFELDGYFNLQMVIGAQGAKIYELNPRFSGSSSVATKAGINIPVAILDHFFGVSPRFNSESLTETGFWRRVTEVFY